VYAALQRDAFFKHQCNAAGRWGIHPLVKTTAVFRHIGYGTSADQLDEQFAIAESTFLETRLKFCEVVFFVAFLCLFGAFIVLDRSSSILLGPLICVSYVLTWLPK
jgi:hypothetical protein